MWPIFNFGAFLTNLKSNPLVIKSIWMSAKLLFPPSFADSPSQPHLAKFECGDDKDEESCDDVANTTRCYCRNELCNNSEFTCMRW